MTGDYPYVGDYTVLHISGGTGAITGDAMVITDGNNSDYFIVAGVPFATEITVVSGSISNSYTTAAAKVQLLKMNDPEFEPASAFGTVDSIGRYGIKNMINQIDYSS